MCYAWFEINDKTIRLFLTMVHERARPVHLYEHKFFIHERCFLYEWEVVLIWVLSHWCRFPGRLCMKMLSFLFVRAWAMPRILYSSYGIPFPVWTPGIISGLTSVVVWLSRLEVIQKCHIFCMHAHAQCRVYYIHHMEFYFRFGTLITFPF